MTLDLPHVRLVLCEGAHDLWVMKRVLECRKNYVQNNVKIEDLPSPLGSFFSRHIQSHYSGLSTHRLGRETPQLSLSMKHSVEDFLLVFFTAGGGVNSEKTRTWLNDLRLVLGGAFQSAKSTGEPVKGTSVSVLVDADESFSEAEAEVSKWWGEKVKAEVLNVHSSAPAELRLWVWPDGTGGRSGTLETVIDDVDSDSSAKRIAIVNLLDSYSTEKTKYPNGATNIASRAKRTKARLGVHAQWSSPGSSWATWLRDEGLNGDYVEANPVLVKLADWLVEGAPA